MWDNTDFLWVFYLQWDTMELRSSLSLCKSRPEMKGTLTSKIQQEVIMLEKLYDEIKIMDDLMNTTFHLIGHAKSIKPVKILVEIYDMLHLTSRILDKYKESDLTFDCLWADTVNIRTLNRHRCELAVYYKNEFKPVILKAYIQDVLRFINLVELRLRNID